MQPTSIADWLAELGLAQYAPTFAENDIDSTMIGDLTDQFLKDLGVSSVGHRMKILRAIAAAPPVPPRRGEILVRHFPERIEAAEAAFGQARAVARAQQARTFELRAALDLARLWRVTSREREARALLASALVGFAETPELPEIGEAQRLLASVS